MHALLGNVTPNLRFCLVDKKGEMVYWKCIFTSRASEIELGTLSVAGTEIIANFLTEHITEEFIRDDNVKAKDLEGLLVFAVCGPEDY